MSHPRLLPLLSVADPSAPVFLIPYSIDVRMIGQEYAQIRKASGNPQPRVRLQMLANEPVSTAWTMPKHLVEARGTTAWVAVLQKSVAVASKTGSVMSSTMWTLGEGR